LIEQSLSLNEKRGSKGGVTFANPSAAFLGRKRSLLVVGKV
jgi:hypothetical protein